MSNKNFRKIVVKDYTFKWIFNDVIQICLEENHNNKLQVDFGYYDSWLYVNDKENEPEKYEPKIVTPAFVRLCIENALKMGWNINLKHEVFKLKYRNKIFSKEK